MTGDASEIFRDTKEVITEAVEKLRELGVFKPEIEIELQSHVRNCVRKEQDQKANLSEVEEMRLTVEIEFDYDGLNENDIDEIEKTLDIVFESGAESTCTELTLLSIKK